MQKEMVEIGFVPLMSYKSFLNNKPLFYDKIDYQRMPQLWYKIKSNFNIPKIIHIVGTNAKGSTGRFISWYLYKSGFKTGHYSSPHILKFNERIWINGKDIDDKSLQKAHEFLLRILENDDLKSLSYFEYTTLMAMYLLQDCDYVIMEAGLGGEYDATNVFEKYISLVTPIDFDHQEFLGFDIKKIALTKLKSITKRAIIGKQSHKEVIEIAKELSKKENFEIYFYNDLISNKTLKSVKTFMKKKKMADFLGDNLLLSVALLRFLNMEINMDLFNDLTLFGRCQKIKKNITIDVGHNVLAANALKECFKNNKVVLIYNSYKDKEYKKILRILKPVVKRVEILPIEYKRIEDISVLSKSVEQVGLKVDIFTEIDEREEYLVFGSFLVVEEFLRNFV